jgi:hypothetical protein
MNAGLSRAETQRMLFSINLIRKFSVAIEDFVSFGFITARFYYTDPRHDLQPLGSHLPAALLNSGRQLTFS